MTGLDQLLAHKQLPYPGARVGYLGHHASVTADGTHGVEALRKRSEWTLCKLFSPEHGFFGTAAAGEKVEDVLHPLWQLPVFSLYGEHRRPPSEWLEDLDLMVVDLQDLGVRCYTYASTLLLMLRACAEAGLPVLVLDRATPLAGVTDGPGLDSRFESFVGMIDLPLVYGLGQGDLAAFLQKHHSELRNLNLQILRTSETRTGEEKWIPPSPAIVHPRSARFYPMTVWCEAVSGVDVDRGGADSFCIWTMPDFPEKLLDTPPAFYGIRAEPVQNAWSGLRFEACPGKATKPVTNAVILLCALRDCLGAARLFEGEKNRPAFFDQLMGTDRVRNQIIAGVHAGEICSRW